jgi:hypothetical protein
MPNQALSTAEIQAIFAEEISDAGGFNSETFDDGVRLFSRAILPWLDDVRPKDQMKGGVAIRATECEICIHPYLFRTVCRNGAIMAHAIETRRIENSDVLSFDATTCALREAVRGCCVEDAFTGALHDVRSTVHSDVDHALTLMPLLSRLPSQAGFEMIRQILFRFMEDPERSRFSLMNAITSVARDTHDPELRWRLEELGGGIVVAQSPTPALDPADTLSSLEWEDSSSLPV